MSATLGGIRASVDLRQLCVGIRDQGSRQSCLACAASDAHSVAHDLQHGLSAEYLYFHAAKHMPGKDISGGLTFNALDNALRSDGQPAELDWPYQTVAPKFWQPPVVNGIWFGGLKVLSANYVDILSALKSGAPVVLGLKLVDGFRRVQKPPHIVDPIGPTAGGHAVIAVGIGRRPASRYDDLLMVRNSWGIGWGGEGHAWLPIEYLNEKLIGCSTVLALKKP